MYFGLYRAADDDLRDILNEIEHSWLRWWKGLLLGSPCSAEDRQYLREAAVELGDELKELTNSQVNVDKLEVGVVDSSFSLKVPTKTLNIFSYKILNYKLLNYLSKL